MEGEGRGMEGEGRGKEGEGSTFSLVYATPLLHTFRNSSLVISLDT